MTLNRCPYPWTNMSSYEIRYWERFALTRDDIPSNVWSDFALLSVDAISPNSDFLLASSQPKLPKISSYSSVNL